MKPHVAHDVPHAMRVPAPVALLVMPLLFGLLAGCAGPTEDPRDDPVTVITDPKDFSGANSTGAHVHDYWGGKDTVPLVDATLSSTWNNVGGRWRRTFVPEDGVVVPQGTASINVTVTWANDVPLNNYGPVSLWVKPANTVEPHFVALVPEGSLEIPVTYEEADLPHQLLSAWEFIVQYNSSATYNAFFGSTHLVATAHRGLELQKFPAHRDLWQNQTALLLLDVTQAFTNIGYTGTGSLSAVYPAAEGVLVPPDAAKVQVAMSLGASNTPAVGNLEVFFHAADSRAWRSLGVISAMQPSAEWEIPLEPGMGDGPYGDASLWQFRVYTPGTDHPTSPALFNGQFHLTATVRKD